MEARLNLPAATVQTAAVERAETEAEEEEDETAAAQASRTEADAADLGNQTVVEAGTSCRTAAARAQAQARIRTEHR